MRNQQLYSRDFWSINDYLGYVSVSHEKLVKHKVSMNQSPLSWILDSNPHIVLRTVQL